MMNKVIKLQQVVDECMVKRNAQGAEVDKLLAIVDVDWILTTLE